LLLYYFLNFWLHIFLKEFLPFFSEQFSIDDIFLTEFLLPLAQAAVRGEAGGRAVEFVSGDARVRDAGGGERRWASGAYGVFLYECSMAHLVPGRHQ
jgi:hypothetical protein